MHVLGTAGHVDHGKSAIVKALSGIDPDRLPEEKQRGLTIDLGFAWFETEEGPLGVVDVPGHERFVRTMVAGVGGIDIVLLVVAADDGWMPQTQEHLDILRLLDVHHGVIVLSKIDLVEESWAALVEDDIRDKTRGTFLDGATIVRTAAIHGQGMDELRAAIAGAQHQTAQRRNLGRARLAVDRVFSMTGQGTVITGTLRDGEFRRDQRVYLFPGGDELRIRTLQTHKHELEVATPGSRVAANLAGVDKQALSRGNWLYADRPEPLPRYVGVELELLPNAPFGLKSRTDLLIIFGTTECHARLVMPDARAMAPGARGVAQLELLEPLTARFGDRFIVRLPTPQVTVGGGRFLEPSPHRYARRHTHAWNALTNMAEGDVAGWLQGVLESAHIAHIEDLFRFYPADRKSFDQALSDGQKLGDWRREGAYLIQAGHWEDIAKQIESTVIAYHKEHPTETGPPSAEILSSARIPQELQHGFLVTLEKSGVRTEGPHFCHQSHRAGLTAVQQKLADAWRHTFADQPFAGPSRGDLVKQSADARPTLEFLLRSEELIELKEGMLFRRSDFDMAVRKAVEAIQRDGELTVSTFRELIGTSRKYAMPILDRCDRMGYTKRVADKRVAGPRAAELIEQTTP